MLSVVNALINENVSLNYQNNWLETALIKGINCKSNKLDETIFKKTFFIF
jgi:hypothetical protein